MADCPNCEYHKQRAQIWRDEVYRLTGHPLPRKGTMTEDDDDIQDYKKPWVGLTDEEIADCAEKMEASDPTDSFWREFFRGIEAKLKEKNNG